MRIKFSDCSIEATNTINNFLANYTNKTEIHFINKNSYEGVDEVTTIAFNILGSMTVSVDTENVVLFTDKKKTQIYYIPSVDFSSVTLI